MNNEALINKSTSNPVALSSLVRLISNNLSKIFYLSIFILIYLGRNSRWQLDVDFTALSSTQKSSFLEYVWENKILV